MHSKIIDTMSALPQTVDGSRLDHQCLHCQLALPVQHFMDRHPEKSREEIVKEMAETLAELVASASPEWRATENYAQIALRAFADHVRTKFSAYIKLRQHSA